MLLRELIQDLADARIVGDPSLAVGPVRDDSRAVAPGDVFVAVRGRTVDGHTFVPKVLAQGAAALVVEGQALPDVPATVPQVVVPSTERALGWLAARAAGRPADRMTMVGVTGTNGKTSTTYLVESILAAAGAAPGVIGTVNNRYAGAVHEATFTTPMPIPLHALFAEMLRAGTTHAVMETTSSALLLGRLEGVYYQVGAFTNLTQDHLDVHGTMQDYFDAKARLFAELLPEQGGTAVAMVDDADGYGEAMLARARAGARKLRVSAKRGEAEIFVEKAESTIAGIRATIRTPRGSFEVTSRALLGEYNVENIALAVGIAEALGLPHDAIARGVAALRCVPGRVERAENSRGYDVFVDYAHTPDALERVIAALRPLTRGRLIVVFGCGGDRDKTKRPKMGRIVARDADVAVVTSDNPRTEEPRSILDMILVGVKEAQDAGEARAAEIVVDPDRRQGIAEAVKRVRPGEGDVVLIAGKGHEDYQILVKTKIHFDDREEAAAAIAALGAAQ